MSSNNLSLGGAAADQAVAQKSSKLSALGPGIMVAAAAIGGSHIVASTQAGAHYGWQLVSLIILVNLFKYPFFQFGARYTAATGESLMAGYGRMGKSWLGLFLVLNSFAAVVNIAALMGLTAALLTWVAPGVSSPVLVAAIALISLVIILLGHYTMVDRVTKAIVVLLSVVTVLATLLALGQGPVAPADFVSPSPWTLASIGFLVALMGWMPAPIEVSAMNSVWSMSKKKERGHLSVKDAVFDMNVGYVGTAILALFFLGMGATVLHGSGIEPAASGAAFTKQLVSMYSSTIGNWSSWLIITAAICCIYSSTLTCVDGYSRTIFSAWSNLQQRDTDETEKPLLILVVTGLAMTVVLLFPGTMLSMLNFAMIAAFLTTPVFGWLNYRLMSSEQVPEEHRPGQWLNLWAQMGMVFLFGFAGFFIWWQWLM
ncbi:NRAMP family divalent metal transporter [Endozoicomonas arenosclerae]|uniref:NRAMP family divalent metal transporter n=1 Tax=Endozoicomonas arenosclerae TaxID=1633495 RepID=UPI0007854F82|nr:divalent metal cation transporter [Endozoicomonas arenosclerae]